MSVSPSFQATDIDSWGDTDIVSTKLDRDYASFAALVRQLVGKIVLVDGVPFRCIEVEADIRRPGPYLKGREITMLVKTA